MSIEILKDDIKHRKFRNLYLFYGPEDYLKKFYLDNIESYLLQDEMKTLNKVVLEGRLDIRKLIDNCETMPVFSDKKVVIVKNSGYFKSGKKSEDENPKSKGQMDGLSAYVPGIPEYTCLIFYESEIDKRIKVMDSIKKNGLVVEFPFQKPADLVKWVVKVFKSNKKDIDTLTASQLVDTSEPGMNEIFNEISKVVMYLGDRQKVNGNDIEMICTKSIKSRIFDLTDAVAEKNASKALLLLNELVAMKEPLPRIIFMVTRQFRHILEMKLLKSSGLSTDEAASKIGITPYAAGKVLKQSGSFKIEKLKEAIEESLEMDTAVKSGKMDERIAVELLISKIISN